MKRLIYAVMLTVFLLPPIAVAKSALLMTDGPLTAIGVLKGRTDENGYLRVSGGTPGATDGPLTAIGNLKGRTDENGYLRVALAGGTMTSALTIQVDAIGATSTDGLRLKNATAAAAGAQQFSPRTCWEGQGWKTDATAASQSVVFCAETQPVQGTSAPSGNWVLKRSINGGAFSDVLSCTSAGACTMASGAVLGANSTITGYWGSTVGYYDTAGNTGLSTTATQSIWGVGNIRREQIESAAVTLTESSATPVVQMAVAAGTTAGFTVEWAVHANDGSDFQIRRGSTYVAAVNKASTETCTVGDVGTTVLAESAAGSTLAVTTACSTTPTDAVNFTISAASSLTQTTLEVHFRVVRDRGTGAITKQ